MHPASGSTVRPSAAGSFVARLASQQTSSGRLDCPSRAWAATPYSKGHKLPSFEDGGGMARHLKSVANVHLTGLPVKHDLQSKTPFAATRQDLRDGKAPAPVTESLPGGLTATLANDFPVDESFPCYVAFSFADNGDLIAMHHGAGSVVVEEGV